MKSLKAALITLAAITVSLFVLSGCSHDPPPPKANPNAIRHDKSKDD